MHIRSLRMQESEGMTSESLSPPCRSFAPLLASRPSNLEGDTLVTSSPVESLNCPQTPSGTITPACTLREAGLHQTSVTSALLSARSTPMPLRLCALVLASSNTAPSTVSALGEDRAPLAACQCILDDLANLLRCLSISERSSVLQSSPASPEPPQPLPTMSINPADLHAPRDASLGGPMPPELPEVNGTLSPVSCYEQVLIHLYGL